jgi:hypothetical protein
MEQHTHNALSVIRSTNITVSTCYGFDHFNAGHAQPAALQLLPTS